MGQQAPSRRPEPWAQAWSGLRTESWDRSLFYLFGTWALHGCSRLAEGFRIPAWGRGGRGVSQAWGPSVGAATEGSVCFFVWFRNWISLSYHGTEPASHTSSLPWGWPRHQPGDVLQVGGRWAGQASGWSGEAGTAKDTSWLWISTRIQKALCSYFHKTRSENTEWTCFSLNLK